MRRAVSTTDPRLRLPLCSCEDDGVAERRKPTARDLVLSLLVLIIPIVAIIWLQDSGQPDEPDVKTVAWRQVADHARQQASFSVLAPPKLDNGWRATRANWTREGHRNPAGDRSVRNQWQLGVLTADDVYIELDQGDKHPGDMIDSATRDAAPDGSTTLDGTRWRQMVTDDGRTRALVHPTRDVTTVITGDTSYDQLRSFAESLRTSRTG